MTSLISMSTLLSPSLTSLELSSCKLARQAGIILSQSLQACRSLKRLVLADNNLRDGGLRAIVDALKALSTAGPVASADNNTSTGATAATTPWCGLDELDISQNGITAAGFSALCHVPVQRLDASDNAIESIGPFLLTNASIVALSLAGNALTDEGAHELLSTLFRDQTLLQTLDLRRCNLSRSSARFLVKTLRRSTVCSLRELWLDEIAADVHGAIAGEDSEAQRLQDMIDAVAASKYPHLRVCVCSDAPALDCRVGARAGEPRSGTAPRSARAPHQLDSELQSDGDRTSTPSPVTAALDTIERVPLPIHTHQQLTALAPAPVLASLPPVSAVLQGTTGPAAASHERAHPLQHVDIEYIVSKTIECMNQNFEQRLGLFLLRMEAQQHEKVRP